MADESLIQNVNLPYSTFVEQGSTPATPDATKFRLFFDDSDHRLKIVDSSGTVFNVGVAGDIAADLDIGSLTEEMSPTSGDMFVMERSSTRYKVDADNLPGGGGGGGAVVAIQSVTKTDTQTTTSVNGSWVDITGLSITYTPTSSSNKILVRFDLSVGNIAGTNSVMIRLMRDATPIGVGDAAGSRTQATTHAYSAASDTAVSASGSILDAPATTSPITYKVQFCASTGGTGTATLNRSYGDGDSSYVTRLVSTLTIMEVTP